MVMLNTPRNSSLILSRGAVLDTTWPAIRDDFPDGATTSIEFYDSRGLPIATVDGTVEPRKLVYLEPDVDKLDSVPGGAQYELFVVTPDGPYKVEYGTVIRREASFFTPVPTSLQGDARVFTDNLGRDAVGRRWAVTSGGIAMHNIGGRYAMGPDIGLLFNEAGMRYYRPMGSDSWRIKFAVLYSSSLVGLGGAGHMRLHMGCDSRLNVGMGFELEVGAGNPGIVYTGIVTSPTNMSNTNSAANTVVDGDIWTVEYSDITKEMTARKGPDPTGVAPVITWEDSGNVLPHGPGYRYWGFSWDASVLATGPLLLSVEAQDYA